MAEKTSWASGPIDESDILTYLLHTGNGWNTWTPTVVQGVSVSCTVGHASYFKAGRFVAYSYSLTMTSSGTSTNNIIVSLPVTAARSVGFVGYGNVNDAGTADVPVIAALLSAVSMIFKPADAASTSFMGSGFGLASGDTITIAGMYEAAS